MFVLLLASHLRISSTSCHGMKCPHVNVSSYRAMSRTSFLDPKLWTFGNFVQVTWVSSICKLLKLWRSLLASYQNLNVVCLSFLPRQYNMNYVFWYGPAVLTSKCDQLVQRARDEYFRPNSSRTLGLCVWVLAQGNYLFHRLARYIWFDLTITSKYPYAFCRIFNMA